LSLRNGPSGCVYFSTSAASATAGSSLLYLRNLVKPFLLKCHPDVQRSDSAKQINLQAIQNLNAYLDQLQDMISSSMKSSKSGGKHSIQLVEIDFVIEPTTNKERAVNGSWKKKLAASLSGDDQQVSMSRRKVELVVPQWQPSDPSVSPEKRQEHREWIQSFALGQLGKLLRVAGLPLPSTTQLTEQDMEALQQELWSGNHPSSADQWTSGQGRHRFQPAAAPEKDPNTIDSSYFPRETELDRQRREFAERIDWNKYNERYAKAVANMHADIATSNHIQYHQRRRRKLIATVLSHTTLQKTKQQGSDEEHDEKEQTFSDDEDGMTMADQLVAFRRLSLLLQDNFESLSMDDLANFWEQLSIVLGPPRPKRYRRRGINDPNLDFCFTLHPDYRVTLLVPIDFLDDELLQELQRNVWDFYNIVNDDSFEQILKPAQPRAVFERRRQLAP